MILKLVHKYTWFIFILWISHTSVFAQEDNDEENQMLYIKNNMKEIDSDSSYISLKKLLKTNKKETFKARVSAVLGQYFNHIGVLDSSKFYLQKAINKLSKEKDNKYKVSLTYCFYQLANCNRSMGLYDESLKSHIKGIQIAEEINDKDYIFDHNSGMGIVYGLKGEFQKAIKQYEYCLANASEKKMETIYGTMINMGAIYYKLKQYDKAKTTFEEALKLVTKEKDYYGQAVLAINLGTIYQVTKDTQKSILYYNQAKQIALEHNMQLQYLNATYNQGTLYNEIEDYDNAMLILSASLVKAKELHSLMFQKNIYEELNKAAANKEDWQQAYVLQKNFYQITDSIKNIQQSKEVKELELKYETVQKEKEISLLKKNELIKDTEIRRQKTVKITVLISFVLILIPIITLLFVYYQKLKTQNLLNQKKEEVNQQKITNLLRKQELKVVRASIQGQHIERKRIAQELHDRIGGNLSAIKLMISSSLDRSKIYKKVTQQIDDTYELVRDLSHNMTPKKFIEYPFTNLLKEYVDNIKSSNQQIISFDPYPEDKLNTIEEKLQIEIYAIFQELFTNTLKHAKARKIDIQLHIIENTIKLLFEDNGIGFNQEKKNLGIGMQNIKNRLETINGVLYIDSVIGRGTVFDIDIPIRYKNEDKKV